MRACRRSAGTVKAAARGVAAAALALFAGAAAASDRSSAFEWTAMGTRIRLTVRGDDAERAGAAMAAAARLALESVESETSAFRAESPLALLRCAAGSGEWVEAGGHFAAALDLALETAGETDGAFNPLVAPFLEALGFARRPPGVAKSGSEAPDVALLDLTKIERRPGACRLALRGMALDFGGLAKGLGADFAAAAARAAATNEFLLDAGGTIVGRGAWRVGLRDPRGGTDAPPLAVFPLRDGIACATSGNYERFVKNADGTAVGHIFDPRAATPAPGGALQVTVFAPTAARADALGTALFVLGPGHCAATIARHPECVALFVLPAPDGGVNIASVGDASKLEFQSE